jgi:hypothetical protein
MTLEINRQILCYLTPEAQKAINDLVTVVKLDHDLALAVLEQLWPEGDIYDLSG